jgi:Protein of unknown function (DUF3892)
MKEYRVTCRDIKETKGIGGINSHIGTIGVVDSEGVQQILDHNQAIAMIKSHTAQFFVEGGGSKAYVIVETNTYGREYLKTIPDKTTADNLLLGLPACTADSGKPPKDDPSSDGGGIDFDGGDVGSPGGAGDEGG